MFDVDVQGLTHLGLVPMSSPNTHDAAALAVDASAASAPATPLASSCRAGEDAPTPATGKPLKTRTRGRPASRPKIDIDDEIQEANRLADLFRRMQAASKVAARNAHRSKQRLMKKASKLSQTDLLRMATLKRCGLVELSPEVPEGEGSGGAIADGTCVMPLSTTSAASVKVKGVVNNIAGARDLLKSLESCAGAASSASVGSSTLVSSAEPVPTSPLVLRGIKRLPSVSSLQRPDGKMATLSPVAKDLTDDSKDDAICDNPEGPGSEPDAELTE